MGSGSRAFKIFGVGLSRTGTKSLSAALGVLGYKACHFPDDRVSRCEITAFLHRPEPSLSLSALRRFDAMTDTPISCTYQALDVAYPGSRFILTTRDKASWLGSCEDYWRGTMKRDLERISDERAAYVHLINRTVYGSEEFDAEGFEQAYDRHEASVRRFFDRRPRDLLALDICARPGWPELCDFLKVDVPILEFPHMNQGTISRT